MAVDTLTEFPLSFVAGDTLRVTFSDSNYPSSTWTAKVSFQSATATKTFTADVGDDDEFELEISAAESAKLAAGLYVVTLIYTETSSSERTTDPDTFAITVYANPISNPTKTIARQTLEAMEAAYLKLSSGTNLSVSFNGQSFTKKNMKDFQDAIERQRAVVSAEDQQRTGHRRIARILHPI